MENSYEVKPFGWKRNWDYIKVNVYLMLKLFTEYKSELYNYFIRIPINLSITFFALFVIYKEFNSILNWSLIEYGYFMTLFEIVNRFVFWTLKPLHRYILDGEFNRYLVRPLNIFVQHNFEKLDPYEIITIIINLSLFFVLTVIDRNFNFLKLNFILFFVLIVVLQFLFWTLFESISFVAIGIKKAIDIQLFEINGILEQYPTQFFSNSRLKYFIIVFPSAFISITLVNILRGIAISYNYFYLILIFLIVISLLIYINWHYGLKKYEAFG